MKQYFLGLTALVLAFGFSAFSSSKTHPAKAARANFTTYYYRFDGNAGQENIMSDWTQLSDQDAYDAVDCPAGSVKGCVIENSTNASGHPTSVPLDGAGLPETTGVNIAVENRD